MQAASSWVDKSHGQVYEEFIQQLLANSIDLKLRADYNERQAEFAEQLKANKVKAKMKA